MPRRALGQHFVGDADTVKRIAALSGAETGDHVLEIGAGLGSLTLALAETGASVVAVEIDAALVGALRHVLAGISSVEVVQLDARTLDYRLLLASAERWLLVSNLPYNIATPLVLDLLRDVTAIRTMVVMVQLEVAERLAAPPGSKSRGIPSVLVERHGIARIVDRVPPSAFIPSPRVESAIVRIDRHTEVVGCVGETLDEASAIRDEASAIRLSDPAEADRFEWIVRTAFRQRRKMLRRSLAGVVALDGFEAAGVDPTARPETLTLQQWAALAELQPVSS